MVSRQYGMFLAAFIVLSIPLQSQSSPIDPQALSFFDHLLLRTANLQDSASDLLRRQSAFASILSLSSSEVAALGTAATQYEAGLAPLEQQALAVTSNKKTLSSVDITALNQIAARRANLVQTIAMNFFAALSPASMQRLHNAGSALRRIQNITAQ